MPGLGQAHHQINDAFLRQRVVRGHFAHINHLGPGGHQRQHIFADQVVVQHHRCLLQGAGRTHCEQIDGPRAGTHERDLARAAAVSNRGEPASLFDEIHVLPSSHWWRCNALFEDWRKASLNQFKDYSLLPRHDCGYGLNA